MNKLLLITLGVVMIACNAGYTRSQSIQNYPVIDQETYVNNVKELRDRLQQIADCDMSINDFLLYYIPDKDNSNKIKYIIREMRILTYDYLDNNYYDSDNNITNEMDFYEMAIGVCNNSMNELSKIIMQGNLNDKARNAINAIMRDCESLKRLYEMLKQLNIYYNNSNNNQNIEID